LRKSAQFSAENWSLDTTLAQVGAVFDAPAVRGNAPNIASGRSYMPAVFRGKLKM